MTVADTTAQPDPLTADSPTAGSPITEKLVASKLLPAATLRALSEPSDRKGMQQLATHGALLALGALGVHAALGSWWLVPAMLLYGWFLVALFAVVHECVHYTVFRGRRANE